LEIEKRRSRRERKTKSPCSRNGERVSGPIRRLSKSRNLIPGKTGKQRKVKRGRNRRGDKRPKLPERWGSPSTPANDYGHEKPPLSGRAVKHIQPARGEDRVFLRWKNCNRQVLRVKTGGEINSMRQQNGCKGPTFRDGQVKILKSRKEMKRKLRVQ